MADDDIREEQQDKDEKEKKMPEINYEQIVYAKKKI
jgi:hypothetical protein